MATAVDLGLDPLFLAAAAVTYSADEFRAMTEAFGSGGVRSMTDFTPSGTGTTVTVTKGVAVVRDTTADTAYVCRRTASTSLDITNGLGMTAGQSRIDLIVVQVFDSTVIGGVLDKAQLKIVAGTAGTSPAAPALPRAAIEIGRVLVQAGQGSLTSVTDTRAVSEHPGTVGRYVSVAGSQTITGQKNFTGGLQVSGKPFPVAGHNIITIDTNGYCTVTHNAGFTPVHVSAEYISGNLAGGLFVIGTDTFTATTFRVRIGNNTSGGPLTISIGWVAFA
jgi:hypothetical protein